jgi:hypothetical protein
MMTPEGSLTSYRDDSKAELLPLHQALGVVVCLCIFFFVLLYIVGVPERG